MESKYLARFQKFTQEELPLRGNRLLVEVLPKEEIKSAGGLIIHTSAHDHKTATEENRPKLAIVLACGTGYVEEDGTEVEMDIQPGAVVLLSPMGLRYYSHFPGIPEFTGETIAMTRDSEVHISWPSLAAYQAYQAKLNG